MYWIRVADVLEVVDDDVLGRDLVVRDGARPLLVDGERPVGKPRLHEPVGVSAVEVARTVPVERQPLAGLEHDLPPAHAIVREQDAGADLDVLRSGGELVCECDRVVAAHARALSVLPASTCCAT